MKKVTGIEKEIRARLSAIDSLARMHMPSDVYEGVSVHMKAISPHLSRSGGITGGADALTGEPISAEQRIKNVFSYCRHYYTEKSDALDRAESEMLAMFQPALIGEQETGREWNDKERLDALDAITEKGRRVILRQSGTGRGWRLHQTTRIEASETVRDAIDRFFPTDPSQSSTEREG
jgi:hypothetical protein